MIKSFLIIQAVTKNISGWKIIIIIIKSVIIKDSNSWLKHLMYSSNLQKEYVDSFSSFIFTFTKVSKNSSPFRSILKWADFTQVNKRSSKYGVTQSSVLGSVFLMHLCVIYYFWLIIPPTLFRKHKLENYWNRFVKMPWKQTKTTLISSPVLI